MKGADIKILKELSVFVCLVIVVHGDIEDEYHFFSMCTHYSSQRNTYCDKIKTKYPFLLSKSHLSTKEISSILNNKSIEILRLTVKFMNECPSVRKVN